MSVYQYDHDPLVSLVAADVPLELDMRHDILYAWIGRTMATTTQRWMGWITGCILLFTFVPEVIVRTTLLQPMGMDLVRWTHWLLCVGYSIAFFLQLTLLFSLQTRITSQLLRQMQTVAVLFSTTAYVVGTMHKDYAEMHEDRVSFCLKIPSYLFTVLFFPMLCLTDAHPIRIRRVFLRFGGPFGCVALGFIAITSRIPGIKQPDLHGSVYVFGVETMNNMDIVAKWSVVLFCLLGKGVWNAWIHPTRTAFLRAPLCILSTHTQSLASQRLPV